MKDGGQLTNTGYGYDGAGNLTTAPGMTITYNGSNQAATRTGSASGSYTFAGTNQNELISQTVPGGATYAYTWGRTDTNDLPLLKSFSNPNGTNYLWQDDSGSPLAIKTYNGGIAYYALDGLGSPVALISTSGAQMASYTYDPYGQVTTTNLTGNVATTLNPYRYAGGLNDRTTGYLKYGQRFYDPTTGRFTQQDSLETLADPSRANRYQYAGSNPVNYVDPTGLEPVDLGCGLSVVGTLVTEIGLGAGLLDIAATGAAVSVLGGIAIGAGVIGIGIGLVATAVSCE